MTPESLITGGDLEQMLSVAKTTPPGAFIEVGVYKGGSAWHLLKQANDNGRKLYLCDTFTGIPYCDPDRGDKHQVGDFSDCSLGEVRKNLGDEPIYVVGIFPKSFLPAWGFERFAFAHLDCDQYQSVKDSCEWLMPRMVHGGVIWFDDVDRLAGATRAAEELFGASLKRDLSHPYVRF